MLLILIGHGSHAGSDSRFNLPGPDLTASELGIMLEPLKAKQVAIVNTASASGDFMPVLSARNRIVITATKSSFERNETLFPRHFVAAFATAGADTDKDERVSLSKRSPTRSVKLRARMSRVPDCRPSMPCSMMTEIAVAPLIPIHALVMVPSRAASSSERRRQPLLRQAPTLIVLLSRGRNNSRRRSPPSWPQRDDERRRLRTRAGEASGRPGARQSDTARGKVAVMAPREHGIGDGARRMCCDEFS